jgi:methanogenic corrinoid protein MtbC1
MGGGVPRGSEDQAARRTERSHHDYSSGGPPAPRALEARIESEIVPRLLVAHRVGPVPPSLAIAASRELDDADVARFTSLVMRADDAAVSAFIGDLTERGVPLDAVYLDLLAPTARALGELWSEDACDFMEVTLALGRLQQALRELGTQPVSGVAAGEAAGHVLLVSLPGEQHTLGLFMVAEFFLRDGWQVSVGLPLSESDLLHTLQKDWFDVIGLTVAHGDRVPVLRQLVGRARRASRNRDALVMVGGRVLDEEPELVGRVGGDAWAPDARQAPSVARALLDWQRHAPQHAASPARSAAGGDGGEP